MNIAVASAANCLDAEGVVIVLDSMLNKRLIEIADAVLGREGRMVDAIRAIGRGEDAFEGVPFRLPLTREAIDSEDYSVGQG